MAETLFTEREVIMRERAAYAEALASNPFYSVAETHRVARLRYPLLKVTRPRVVTDDSGIFWRVVSGRFEYAWPGHNVWKDALAAHAGDPGMTPARVRMLSALLDNPTEEVPDDE